MIKKTYFFNSGGLALLIFWYCLWRGGDRLNRAKYSFSLLLLLFFLFVCWKGEEEEEEEEEEDG